MSLIKNLQEKNYNPCGSLTGREIKICDAARKSYFDFTFTKIMRNIVIAEIGSMMPNENFENAEEIKSWSNRTLDEPELLAALDMDAPEFENFSEIERGLCKFSVHVLRENRYNIFYNRLVDYCNELDEEIFLKAEKNNLTFEVLEQKINFFAQEGKFSMTFNNLTDEFLNFLMGYVNQ